MLLIVLWHIIAPMSVSRFVEMRLQSCFRIIVALILVFLPQNELSDAISVILNCLLRL